MTGLTGTRASTVRALATIKPDDSLEPCPALPSRYLPLPSPGLFGSAVLRYERPIGQSTFKVRVLPARAGYLTRPDEDGGVVVAIREASTRWAGVSEPIIPVPAGDAVAGWWVQTLELAEVDGLVNVNIDPDLAETVARTLSLPVVDLADIDESGRTRFTTHPANLRQARTEVSGQLPVLARADGDLWEKTAAGDLTADQEADCRDASFPTWRPGTADIVGLAQLAETSWLDIGAVHFAEHQMVGSPFPAPAVVWVTHPNSVEDCVYYWNLRALRSRTFRPAPMVLVPADEIFHWTTFANSLTGCLTRPENIEPDVILSSLSVGVDQLDEIARSLGLIRSTEPPKAKLQFPPAPLKRGPFTYRHDIAARRFFSFPRRYGETADTMVQVYRDSTVVDVESPVQFTGGGRVLIRLASSAFDGLPKRPTTARLIKHDASWSEDELEYATYAQNRYRVELCVPTLSEAIWALLKDQDTRARLSDKGRLASRLNELGAVEVLLQDSVMEVIKRLQTPRSKNLLRELDQQLPEDYPPERLEKLASELGGRAKRRYLSLANLKEVGEKAGEAAELLCSRSWAERGLAIKCGSCGIGSFVPLRQAESEPRCPACGAIHTTFEPASGPKLHYRLNALVDRAADQGVIPHLLAVALLTSRDPETFLLPGIDLHLRDDAKGNEVDLYGITQGKIVAGEAKTNPAWFDTQQIERDIELSALLAADIHVIVSAGRIPEAIEEQARNSATSRGLDLLVLDSRHMAP